MRRSYADCLFVQGLHEFNFVKSYINKSLLVAHDFVSSFLGSSKVARLAVVVRGSSGLCVQ